ncbi:MAG: permease, partial [Deltaproteobacteria bacterium]|nr:permease [Deltaproteobacteria bacterium]
MGLESDHSCCDEPRKRAWYKNRLILASLASGGLFVSGWIFPLLKPFQQSFLHYVRLTWWALLLGFLLAGLIDRYIPSRYISKILAHPSKRTIIYSAGLGLILSACSHGILAIAMQLHKKGASGPAIISFLLGSPWANLPVTLLLVSLFKINGFLIILSAILVSIVTGFIFLALDRAGLIEKNKNTLTVDSDFSIGNDLKRRWNRNRAVYLHAPLKKIGSDLVLILHGSWSLANMILWWLLIGITLASLIGAFVPPTFFNNYLGRTVTGLLLTLVAATVIEICSEGSAPLAFEIYKNTGALGNTFAFLMGGFVTDYTEVGLVGTNLGWRTALWMVGVALPQV